MAVYLSPIGNDQFVSDSGAPLSGGTIETYLAGTSTPATTYTDNTGSQPHSNPIVLNTLGLPNTPGTAIWLSGGVSYKFIVKNSVGVVQRTIDNITGVNDPAFSDSVSEWVQYGTAPTFINATSFSVPGDQTNIFQVLRRLRTMNTGGTVYSTITASSYSSISGLTTVTVLNDSGVLDAGLSIVSYGILSAVNPSIPERTIAKNLRAATSKAEAYTALAPPRSHIAGLVNIRGSASSFIIQPGECADSTNARLLVNTVSFTKTTAAWAAGTNNGGLDTGTIANTTAYYFYLIYNPTSNLTDVVFSTNSSLPVLPSGYTFYRLVGYGFTNGSAQWNDFTSQEGPGGSLDWVWSAPTLDLNTTTLTTSRLLTTLTVPALVGVVANLQANANNAGAATVKIQCPDETDAAPSATASPGADVSLVGGVGISFQKTVRVNSSGQIASRSTAASTTLRVVTNGFNMPRR